MKDLEKLLSDKRLKFNNRANANIIAEECLSNIRTVKSFASEDFEL
jgi:hypothetical protein